GTAQAQPRQAQPAADSGPAFPTRPESGQPAASSSPASATASRPAAVASGEWEPLRGTRRTMARTMSESAKRVVPTTLMDDADIHAWHAGEDVTFRLLRALAAGA